MDNNIIPIHFNNGGQIPAYGNEKTKDQLIDELSQKNRDMRRALNGLIEVVERRYIKWDIIAKEKLAFAKEILNK